MKKWISVRTKIGVKIQSEIIAWIKANEHFMLYSGYETSSVYTAGLYKKDYNVKNWGGLCKYFLATAKGEYKYADKLVVAAAAELYQINIKLYCHQPHYNEDFKYHGITAESSRTVSMAIYISKKNISCYF